jgi:hypothetical protein
MDTKALKPRSNYDSQADVLYVGFGDAEPVFTEDVDDNETILLEIGVFSGLPRGFRIIGPKKHNIKQLGFQVWIQPVKARMKSLLEERIQGLRRQEPDLERIAEQELQNALAACG